MQRTLKDPIKRWSDSIPAPCAACGVRESVFCSVLSDQELQQLSSFALNVSQDAREIILSEGDSADHLFNVTEGLVKLYKLLPDGREQITGFLFSGDFLGIAMNDTYAYSAEAITPVRMCRFNRKDLEGMFRQSPHLETRMLNMASNELAQAQDQILLLGRKTAKERVCSFLLSLSQRAERRGESAHEIPIPMGREAIADYLGLTTETVSRTFSKLKKENVIKSNKGGVVEIPDLEELASLAEDSS